MHAIVSAEESSPQPFESLARMLKSSSLPCVSSFEGDRSPPSLTEAGRFSEAWSKLEEAGWVESPPGRRKPLSGFAFARPFGDRVAVVCRQQQEPSEGAMALMWQFGACAELNMVSRTRPAHMLKYIPDDLCFRHTPRLGESTTAFLVQPSRNEVLRAALLACVHSKVVLIGADEAAAAGAVALLKGLRPDLDVFGCAASLPAEARPFDDARTCVDAYNRVGHLLSSGTAFVARSLTGRDARWIAQQTGSSNLPAGSVVFAPFDGDGLDRELFQAWRDTHPARVRECLAQAQPVETQPPMAGTSAVLRASGAERLRMFRKALRGLGPTAVFGASGQIGSAIVEVLAGKVPVLALTRRPALLPAAPLGSPRHAVRAFRNHPQDALSKTVFITSSVAFRPDPETGKIVFERAALLEDNLRHILLPVLRELPRSVRLVQIITNPCSDLAFAAWLLRPDLASAISAHVGTDITRQRAHVETPGEAGSYFTLGPHSAAQVNVDLVRGQIDSTIPHLGDMLIEEAGERSVTDPTAMASVVEAASLVTHRPGSYGLPLRADEAARLSKFMADLGHPIEVSEGVSITLPRGSDKEIVWPMLGAAAAIPGFGPRARAAILELEMGRARILDWVLRTLHNRPAMTTEIDTRWVLAHRRELLSLLD